MSFDGYVDENGKLVPATTAPTAQELVDLIAAPPVALRWFREGDEVEVSGHLFRVKSVKPTEIRIKLIERRKE
jgi:hypothetical protein